VKIPESRICANCDQICICRQCWGCDTNLLLP